jgi:hypothetical protein
MRRIVFILFLVTYLWSGSALDARTSTTFWSYFTSLAEKAAAGDGESQAVLLDHYTSHYIYLGVPNFEGIARSGANPSAANFPGAEGNLRSERGTLSLNGFTLREFVLGKNSDPFSLYVRGTAMQYGVLGQNKNVEEGKKLVSSVVGKLEEFAEAGNSNAGLILFYIYAYGQSTRESDYVVADKWLARAAKKEDNPIAALVWAGRSLPSDNPNVCKAGLSWVRSIRDLPEDIEEGVVLASLLKSNIKSFEVDKNQTGFNGNEGVCTLRHKASGLTLVLYFEAKSQSPFSCGDLTAFEILSIADRPVIRGNPVPSFFYRLTKSDLHMNMRRSPYHPTPIGLAIKGWDKIDKWIGQARETMPDAFSKPVPFDENHLPNYDLPIFVWDGLCHAMIESRSSTIVSRAAMFRRKFLPAGGDFEKQCQNAVSSAYNDILEKKREQRRAEESFK